MIAPLSWLKEYVNIKLDPKTLGEKLTEVGLGCEKVIEKDGDILFELEITPNRPDWLSIIGVAREIAAIEGKEVTYPVANISLANHPAKTLPLTIQTDFALCPRLTGIIIDGVTVKDSPLWLKEKLVKIGLRPISNIVDITNYVMAELGNPLHAFDYDRIHGHTMHITQARGGEVFKSVDEITYHLPEHAVIVRDIQSIIDLCGIKGGFSSGVQKETTRLFLWAPVENSVLVRKTSQSLGLRSEASSIFERGVNAGGTIEALQRAVDLIISLAGGKLASRLYDLRERDFAPWKLTLREARLAFILGITIPEKDVLNILSRLQLSPRVRNPGIIECSIPTYRNDLQIEEDLIEEVARIYGYNNFPKTLPIGEIPIQTVPYFKDFRLEEKIKNIFVASGFSEVYTYSLISEKDLEENGIESSDALRIDNPISSEYEYLRPTLKVNLCKAVKQNREESENINLFELGKVYKGTTLEHFEETYHLAGISTKKTYAQVKGIIEQLYQTLGITENPSNVIHVVNEGIYFDIAYTHLLSKISSNKAFIPLPKYPPIIEDIALVTGSPVPIQEIIDVIKSESMLVSSVTLLDRYKNILTFHVIYQDKEKNLTRQEIKAIRDAFIKKLNREYKITPK